MAGTLVINDKSDWLPAGWVFDNVLEAISAEIRTQDPSLAELLNNSRTTVSQGYLDLRQQPIEIFQRITMGAEQALAKVRLQGSESFADTEFYRGYLTQLECLCRLLHADPRGATAG
jgi:hypothetical protein